MYAPLLIACVLVLLTNHVQSDDRIVGGVIVTDLTKFPYQVSLKFTKGKAHFCGGIILDEKNILTAGHCVIQSEIVIKPDELFVVAGTLKLNDLGIGGVESKVKYIFTHKDYDPKSDVPHHDMAVLRLETPLKFTTTIKSIGLATTTPADGTLCTVSGWGALGNGGLATNDLYSVEIPRSNQKACKDIYATLGATVLDSMLCAIASGKDSCQGDSGGPMRCNDKIAGVVSWGNQCATPNYPGVYSDVASFTGWVDEQKKRNSSSIAQINILFVIISAVVAYFR